MASSAAFSKKRLISVDLADKYLIRGAPSDYFVLSGGPHNQDGRTSGALIKSDKASNKPDFSKKGLKRSTSVACRLLWATYQQRDSNI